ncbi:MAG: RsmD family RNA methyltransferase [Muribaculaceae bacterium]|nr:RsmD family RNA methyltransferase [Muribaculaceae bacterium]
MISDSLEIYRSLSENTLISQRLEEFICQYCEQDPTKLRLKMLGKDIAPQDRAFIEFAILQLEARKKYSSKFLDLSKIIFPSKLAAEQASNTLVSRFHSQLIGGASSLLDMTAGLGIDFLTMSKAIGKEGKDCVAVELDPVKAECLRYNLSVAGIPQAEVICGDSLEILKKYKLEGRRFDLIYVDPARRDEDGSRLYDPAACLPDIVSNRNLLFDVADRVLVKNSPMVDVAKALEIFPDTEALYLVAVKNECKELLIDMRKDAKLEKLVTVDILSNGEHQIVELSPAELGRSYNGPIMEEDLLKEWIEKGMVWMYEPSSTQMKLKTWNYLAEKFNVVKGSPNSHIFFSRECIEDFPGRIMIVERILDKKSVKELKGQPRNVVTRNYPLKAVPLAKKLRINSSNDRFIYGLTISSLEYPLLLDTRLD